MRIHLTKKDIKFILRNSGYISDEYEIGLIRRTYDGNHVLRIEAIQTEEEPEEIIQKIRKLREKK